MKKLKRTFSEKLGRLSPGREEKDTGYRPKNTSFVKYMTDISSSGSDTRLTEKCNCEKLQRDKNDNKMILNKLTISLDEKNHRSNSWSHSSMAGKSSSSKGRANGNHNASFHGNKGALTSVSEDGSTDVFLNDSQSNGVKIRSYSESVVAGKEASRRFSSYLDSNCCYGKIESYECLEVLGEGSYATVYKGRIKNTEQLVALKKVTLNMEEGTPFTAIREVSLLKTLKHANIVTLFDIIHTNTDLTLVFEYMSTDLSLYMEKKGCTRGINPRNAVIFTYQLLRGLEYCHQRKVLHRDLKPQNLLISEIGELKLADFGLARAKSIPTNTYSNEVVTLWYRPPDVLLGSTKYTTSLDIWGVGCIFLEMLTGTPICPGQTDACDQLEKIFEILGTPSPGSWPQLSEFCHYEEYSSCFTAHHRSIPLCVLVSMLSAIEFGEEFACSLLQYEPTKRLSAYEAMRHPMFQILPPEIHNVPATDSIFSIPQIKLIQEENSQPKPLQMCHLP